MPDELAEAVTLLMVELDARPVRTTRWEGWRPCPVCGVLAAPSANGHRALCLVCTVREIGALPSELAAAAFHKVKVATWQAWVDMGVIPSLTYRTWRRRTGR